MKSLKHFCEKCQSALILFPNIHNVSPLFLSSSILSYNPNEFKYKTVHFSIFWWFACIKAIFLSLFIPYLYSQISVESFFFFRILTLYKYKATFYWEYSNDEYERKKCNKKPKQKRFFSLLSLACFSLFWSYQEILQ